MKLNEEQKISRRRFSQVLMGAGAATITPLPTIAKAETGEDNNNPHFYLQVVVAGAIDQGYLFDARPLEFTDASKMQNYLYKNGDFPLETDTSMELLDDKPMNPADPLENKMLPPLPKDQAAPKTWQGANGTTTLVSPLAHKLEGLFKSDFSIVNGVVMSRGISHGENMNVVYTGKPINKTHIIPELGSGQSEASPLEGVHIGAYGGDGPLSFDNFAGSVNLDQYQGAGLANTLKAGKAMDSESGIFEHIMSRLKSNSLGTGSFRSGAAKMTEGVKKSLGLRKALLDVDAEGFSDLTIAGSLEVGTGYMKSGITNAVSITLDYDLGSGFFNIDAHGSTNAKKLPYAMKWITREIELIFNHLKNTDYDDTRKMIDVTTVVITSEFSRTMRTSAGSTDVLNTGTEHNPLTNTVLIGGKGVIPNLIIGQSDLQEIEKVTNDLGEETWEYKDVSEAHRQREITSAQGADSSGSRPVAAMGKPFDFETMKPQTKPASEFPTFDTKDYITYPTIINTVYDLFNMPNAQMKPLMEQAPVNGTVPLAPSLTGLLKKYAQSNSEDGGESS